MEDIDYNLVPSALLKQVFPDFEEDGDSIVFMQKCKKYNRYGLAQERVLVLSSDSIYLFSNKKVNTICDVRCLSYVIKCNMSKEFIMSFEDAETLRLTLEDREDFLLIAKMRFVNLCPKKGLRIYGIPAQSLKQYAADRYS